MDDVVGVIAEDSVRGRVGFVTYGRLWDPVDPAELLANISAHLPECGIENVVSLSLCDTLSELREAPYFFESLISFSWRPIPFGPNYEQWRESTRREVELGRHIYCVGNV